MLTLKCLRSPEAAWHEALTLATKLDPNFNVYSYVLVADLPAGYFVLCGRF